MLENYEGIVVNRPYAAFSPKGDYALIAINGHQAWLIKCKAEIDQWVGVQGIEWVAVPRKKLTDLAIKAG